MNRAGWRRLAVLALFVVLALGTWRLFFARRPVAVDVLSVGPGTVEQLVTNSRAGSVRARLRAQVGSETTGRVAEIPHREGAEVDSGAVLVRLADDVARAQVTLTRRELDSARANLVAAESTADLAGLERSRADRLIERGAIAEEAVDGARARDNAARAEVDAARAQVQRAQAAQRLAETELERHWIRAPFPGVINQLYVEAGASVVPGQALLELMSRKELYVSAPMDELDIARIRVGLPARITLDPYPNDAFEAVVSRVAPFVSEIQEQNRTMEVELRLLAVPEHVVLHPGTSADVEIILERHEDVLRVPALSLLEGERVFVVNDGQAEIRQVRVGLRNWDWAEVLDGLERGDRVITTLERADIKPGVAVVVRDDGRG